MLNWEIKKILKDKSSIVAFILIIISILINLSKLIKLLFIKRGSFMNLKKLSKLVILLAASTALTATLIKDKKENKESNE